MEEGIETSEKENGFEGEGGTALQAGTETSPTAEFVKVEKNLASLGFFTPSSKRTRNEKSKTVTVTVTVDGKRIEAKATIAPTALFGLPITADQDKWLALHKILSDLQVRDGQVANPISFTSAELLALLNIYKDSGKNYKDVSDWLDVMVGTTIISEGAVYFAGKRSFGKDTFHVFDRAVSFGKELPDGSIADKNYVWLSQWQLQNINAHHQLPIDLDTYRQLRNYIAKALVPLLQIWLYATREEGVFEKRYDELCQILNIRQWNYPSKIKEKLGPSLDELKQLGYLADWRIETTSDKHAYKILLFHGEKFYRDRRDRLSRKRNANALPTHNAVAVSELSDESRNHSPRAHPGFVTPPRSQTFDPQLIAEFTHRGITKTKASQILANLKPGQDVVAQIEHAEQIVQQSRMPITNPAGFIIRLIEMNTPVPDGFETSVKRKIREEREKGDRERHAAEEAQQELEWEYENYCESEIDRYIAANGAAFEALKDAKWKEDRERFSFTTESMARLAARYQIRKQIQFLTFEEFLARKKEGSDFSLKLVGPSAVTDATPFVPVAQGAVAVSDASEALLPNLPAALEPEATIEASAEPAASAATPEPPIADLALLLIPNPPHQEPGGNAAERGIA